MTPTRPTVDDQPTVSTYHAYAASLIKDHALRIGREPDSRLLTEAARWQLALRVVQSARGPFSHLELDHPARVTQHVLDLDGELSEHLASSADVRAFDARIIAEVEALASTSKPVQAVLEAAEQARARDELLGLVDRYRERKRALDLVDFGDQVALAAEIARLRPEVGQGERSRFADGLPRRVPGHRRRPARAALVAVRRRPPGHRRRRPLPVHLRLARSLHRQPAALRRALPAEGTGGRSPRSSC